MELCAFRWQWIDFCVQRSCSGAERGKVRAKNKAAPIYPESVSDQWLLLTLGTNEHTCSVRFSCLLLVHLAATPLQTGTCLKHKLWMQTLEPEHLALCFMTNWEAAGREPLYPSEPQLHIYKMERVTILISNDRHRISLPSA